MSEMSVVVNASAGRLRPVRAVGLDARRRQSWFYSMMWLVACLLVAAGFGRSFYHMATLSGDPTVLLHVHSAVYSAWLVLFITQVWFVSSRNIRRHMFLGYFGVALAVLMVVVGWFTAIEGGRRGFTLDAGTDPLAYMGFPLGNLLAFAILVGFAYWYRRRPEVHRRLMLLATVGPLMTAPLAHLFAQLPDSFNRQPPIYRILMLLALFFSCAIYDRVTLGRFNKVSLWVGLALFLWVNFLARVIVPSNAWHYIAAWLVAGGA